MFKLKFHRWFFSAAVMLLLPASGLKAWDDREPAGRLSLGLGAGFAVSEYKDTEVTVSPLPIVNYEGERFYWRGLAGGLRLWQDGGQEVSVFLSYLPQRFKAGDSDDRALRRLDDRRTTMMAGAGYRVGGDWGNLGLSASLDALGRHQGVLVNASYAYPLRLDAWTLTPRGGVIWADGNYQDYYYGLSRKESLKSGLREYEADGGLSPYLGLNLRLEAADRWSVFVDGGAVFLNDEITDSPMVDRRVKYTFGAGLTYELF